jgi:hypothetical protein
MLCTLRDCRGGGGAAPGPPGCEGAGKNKFSEVCLKKKKKKNNI